MKNGRNAIGRLCIMCSLKGVGESSKKSPDTSQSNGIISPLRISSGSIYISRLEMYKIAHNFDS